MSSSGYKSLIPPREDYLERRVRDLERQVLELQAGRRLSAASFRGGAFRFLDDDGAPRMVLGNVDNSGEGGGEQYGIFFYGDGGATLLGFREGDRGQAFPPQSAYVFGFQEHLEVTSGAWTSTYGCNIKWPTQELLAVRGFVEAADGGDGELRLLQENGDLVTDVITLDAPGTGSQMYWFEFLWLHPAQCGIYDTRNRYRELEVYIQLRRTASVGHVTMWWPRVFDQMSRWLADAESIPYDTGGAPQLVTVVPS